jgi:P27 family predicted phage terminase small subunit
MDGRKPKPTKLKILEGTRKDRINKNEPKPDSAIIPCPEYLREDEIAYEEWNRIVPELYKLGLLTNIDRTVLELYCSQYSMYRKALREVEEKGITTTNIRNGDKAHPATQIVRESAKLIKAFAVEFGLTPSSRGRIQLPSGDNEDPMEKWFKDRR